jgi:hypothetical protein
MTDEELDQRAYEAVKAAVSKSRGSLLIALEEDMNVMAALLRACEDHDETLVYEQSYKNFYKYYNRFLKARRDTLFPEDSQPTKDILDDTNCLSREFLLSRGTCCGFGCKNCPYSDEQ